jgi:hypothetical protein
MSALTLAVYACAVLFLVVMLIGPRFPRLRFATRLSVNCPADGRPAELWARPVEGPGGGTSLRLEECSRLHPGQGCDAGCLKEVDVKQI